MYRGVLSLGLGSHWRREVLRTSLWFVPALEVVAAIVLFAGTLAVDRAAYHGDFTLPGLAFGAYTLRAAAAGLPDQQLPVVYAADSQVHDIILAGP